MNTEAAPNETKLPGFCDWSVAAVRLLQGVVYADDDKTWTLVLANLPELQEYLGRLGLLLTVDESEGFAYLRQIESDDFPDGYDRLPKLFRRTRLGYGPTLLCVLLRDALLKFDEQDVDSERCVVETDALFEQWRNFFPKEHDELKLSKDLTAALRKLEELAFVRRYAEHPESWEVRRILKARLPAAELEDLRSQLAAARHPK